MRRRRDGEFLRNPAQCRPVPTRVKATTLLKDRRAQLAIVPQLVEVDAIHIQKSGSQTVALPAVYRRCARAKQERAP